MTTRSIAITIAFAAVTIVLNPAFLGFAFPAPFLPYVSYYIWEIPIVAAFFLIGPKYGFFVVGLNALVLQVVFPNHPFIHPIFHVVSGSSMLLGAYFGYRLVTRERDYKVALGTKLTIYATLFGTLSRTLVMTLVNYSWWTYVNYETIGFELPPEGVLAIIPLIVLFNVTIALYTIPIGCFIAKVINRNFGVVN